MTAAVLTAADGDLPDIPGQPYVSPDDLASIGPLWQQAVQQQLVPVVAEVYQTSAGVVHAQMVDATQVPTLPSVGSLAAEQYLAAASNTFEQVGDDLWATARSELLDGFEKGESIDQLAARLRASAGMTAKKAVLVARTQVLDASNAGSMATARAAGIDMQKEWMSAEDLRVRPEHVLANGQKVDLNAKFTVGGYECDRPHDPTLPPALRYSCRCTTGYLIPDDSVDDAVRDAEPVPPVPGTSGVVEPLPDPYAGDLVAPALPGPGVGVPGEAAPLPGLAVRPVLEAARTTSAVQSVFAAETRRITGRFIPIRFTGSAATAREHAEGLLRGLERFPDARLGGVDAMEARGAAYAATSYNEILFSELWTSPAARRHYLGSVASDVQDGWHVANSGNPVAIALHEFGHLLDFTTDINRGVRVRIREIVARRAAAEGVGQDVLIRREVSGYATSHTDELVAEAFTDVMINGEAASGLSREIFTLLEDAYRQAGGTVRAVVKRELAFSLPSPTVELATRTVPQLRALAKERGITIPPGSKKADIVRLLDEGPGAAPVAAPVVEVPLAKRTVAQLRALAADRNITIPKGAKKPDIVRLLEAPPLTEAEERAAVRALARETNTLIEQTSATARVLAEVDELLAKKATASTIREAIADALVEPGQLFAGADPAVLAALRAVASDPVKLRAAVTRLGGKAKIKPVSKAGAKVTFDADTMEGVGGIDIEAGARVTVVRRGSTVTLPDGTVMQLEKARVTPVTAPVKAVKAVPVKRTPAAKKTPAAEPPPVKAVPRGATPPARPVAYQLPPGVTEQDATALRLALKRRQPIEGMPGADNPGLVERLAVENNADYLLGQFQSHVPAAGRMTTAQIQADLADRAKAAFADRAVATNVDNARLEEILTSGRFKTQFETGRSGGIFQPEERALREEQWFGIPADAAPETRPIYGYLVTSGDGKGLVDVYGGARVVFRTDVRERTTAMVGDSMEHILTGRPAAVDNPDWYAFTIQYEDPLFAKLDRNYDGPAFNKKTYIEAQIHGGVTVDDIAEVIFTTRPSPELVALLRERGIPWRMRRR